MATPTYTPIASITLGSSASSVTFSSIPQDYRDLVLVFNGRSSRTNSNNDALAIIFNNGTTADFSSAFMSGNGSSAASGSSSGQSFSNAVARLNTSQNSNTQNGNAIIQIMDYSATDKHKTIVSRGNHTQSEIKVIAYGVRWAQTAAVTEIDLTSEVSEDFVTGSTFSLFGIEA